MSSQLSPNSSEDNPGSKPLNHKSASIEEYTKAIAFFALVAYTLGLLVVNSFLSYMGASDFDLFKPQVVATGVMLFALVGLSTSGFWIAAWILRNRMFKASSSWLKRLEALFGSIVILLLAWLVFSWLSSGESLNDWIMNLRNSIFGFFQDRRSLVGTISLFCISALVGSVAVLALVAANSKGASSTESWLPSWSRVVALVSLLGVVSLLFISKYAREVYPKVPSYLGGGTARPVYIVVKPDIQPTLTTEGVPTGAVQLLFEGSTFYMIRRRDEDLKIYRISKEDVIAINLGERPFVP